MTQEDKQLLLVDLCARLPYGVKANSRDGKKIITITPIGIANFMSGAIDIIKPYLRPMSSMTEEEKKEYQSLCEIHTDHDADDNVTYYYFDTIESFDWLNAHHFDYRGLIEKGLAISEEKFNPYKYNDYLRNEKLY